MGFSRKLLAPGEEVVLQSHPNWSILIPRGALATAVVAACVAVVVLWSAAPLWVGYILLAVGLLALAGMLAKIVAWRSTTLVITNARVIYRTGAIRRFGREIPLSRVQDVTYRQSLVGRMLGAGSLTVESAGQSGQEPFPDIAHPAMVQSLINSLTFGHERQSGALSGQQGPEDRHAGSGNDGAPAGRAPLAAYKEQPAGDPRAGGSGWPTGEVRRTPAYGQPPPSPPGSAFPPEARGRHPEEGARWDPPLPKVLPPRWVGATRDKAPAAGPEEGPQSTSDQLARLIELHRLGVITDHELADKRRELLSGDEQTRPAD